MTDYKDLFPNTYKDSTGNLEIDEDNVRVSGGSLEISRTSITTNQDFTANADVLFEQQAYIKRQDTPVAAEIPVDFITLGVTANGQLYYNGNGFNSPKFVDSRGFRALTENTAIDSFDEFFLFNSGTQLDPLIVTMPTANLINNAKVYYIGIVGSSFGQLQSGNVDMVLININDGSEAFRGTNIDLDTGAEIIFRYTVISTNPVVAQWSAGIGGA